MDGPEGEGPAKKVRKRKNAGKTIEVNLSNITLSKFDQVWYFTIPLSFLAGFLGIGQVSSNHLKTFNLMEGQGYQLYLDESFLR